jgi:hypothetical protein
MASEGAAPPLPSRRRRRRRARPDPVSRVLQVENPYGYVDSPAPVIQATQTLRNDPLASLHARKSITDIGYAAGMRYRQMHAVVSPLKSPDYARDIVDEGRHHSPIGDHNLAAARQLYKINLKLGEQGALLLTRLLVNEMPLREIAGLNGSGRRGSPQMRYLTMRTAECLETVAKCVGLLSHRRKPVSDDVKAHEQKSPVSLVSGGAQVAQGREACPWARER